MTIAELIVARRKRQEWTQDQLAKQSGVSYTTIQFLEAGRVRDPRWSTLRAVASALSIQPKELFACEP